MKFRQLPGSRIAFYLTALCLLAGASLAHAQDEGQIAAPPLPSPDALDDVALPDFFFWRRIGPFDISPYISAGVRYDDNIFIRSQRRVDDVIWNVSPGISGSAAVPGERSIHLDYSPNFIFYTQETGNNSIDHSARLSADYRFSRLTLGVGQTYRKLSGAVIEVGDRVDRDLYSTRLTSHYDYTDKTSFEVNASMHVADYRQRISSTEWSNDNWIGYQIRPKINLGLGATFGYLDVDVGPSQVYQQALLRARYDVTAKVRVTGSAGTEFRQFRDRDMRVTPVFSMAGNYQPWDGTVFTLGANRRIQASPVVARQNFVSTSIHAGVRQRFLQWFFVGVNAGYTHYNYEGTVRGVASTRQDDYYFVRGNFDWPVTERVALRAFNMHRKTDSSVPGLSFTNNQVGLSVFARF